MEMRAMEDIVMGEDLTPPLPPIAFSLYNSFLSSHCSSCSLPLPTSPFTPTFPPNYSHIPSSSAFLYCSPLCSSLDSPLHFSSSEHRLPPSRPDSADLRLSLRLLHLFPKFVNLERIGGLITNYRRVMSVEEKDDDDDDEVTRMISDGAKVMVRARARRMLVVNSDYSVEAAVLCLVMMNAVQVQENNGRAIGIAVYDSAFSWINHSCSPNACYRFSTVRPDIRGGLRLLISPATMDDDCGAEPLNNTLNEHKFKALEGNGPRIIVRSIKGIKKGEEVTISYTDLLQPKGTRQSELWSKYRFNCSCKRCSAVPATYVDHVLQEASVRNKEEIDNLKDCFDDAVAEYISFNNPESCCEKLETLLTHDHIREQLEPKNRETEKNSKLNLLHHLSLDAYTTLASGYNVLARDLLAFSNGNEKHQVEALNKIRASATYSLLLAVLTHHLFLSEPSLVASVANYWGSAGESLLSFARSSVWEAIFKLAPAVSESSFLNHECYGGPQLNRYLINSFCSQDQIAKFDDVSWHFQNCIADYMDKTWSFLTHEGRFLKQIKDLDYRWLLTNEPTDPEVTLTINHSKQKGSISGSALQPSNQLRGNIFQLGLHCLLYGAFLSRICYGQDSELASNTVNFLHSQVILA